MLVLFDGVCHLCSRSVQFLLRHDPKGVLRFASLQSSVGRDLLKKCRVPVEDPPSSIILIQGNRAYSESDAALRILQGLGGAWKLTASLRLVPRPVRNWVYRRIASNRYSWFGKSETCWIPAPEWRQRFLDASETPEISKSP